jgi:hypothetical protein
MGFRHGDGSEKLLVCTNCNSDMELDARFCVECGIRRTDAIGVKNSALHQNEEFNDSKVKLNSEVEVLTESPTEVEKLKKKRDPKIRMAVARYASSTGVAIRRKAKLIYLFAGLSILIGTYGILQTFIFTSSNPENFAKEYIQAVIERDSSKVGEDSKFFPNPEKLPIIPGRFQKWDEIDGLTWKTYSEWNGWSGKGFIRFVPMEGNSIKENLEFELPIKATYRNKYGIFRDIEWAASEPMATVNFKLVNEKNIGISINNVPAGSAENPLLNKKKYVAFPGPFKTVLTGSGFTKERENSVFISSSPLVEISFPKVEYDLNASQVTSARTQLEDRLISCLKRACSDLPRLTQFNFSFSNQPSDYLYTDYFYVDWGKDPSCSVSNYSAKSAESGSITLSCSTYAYGSIKWILYRIWLTTYYDTGYDSTSVPLTVSANVTRTSNPYQVKLSNIQITS